ncbi:phosphoadenosine phosphosulfate reductase domain-containing protein [Hufsiella ginkgonis]|uniref:Phosphoadenosine phosphosulfate reductase family protein n=1 Tax=Hufsiella ginkgonis TaxID=2695274 RepID=A0A7K1Y0X6_9SPHI|nr:phosphoadenosine phosphosulfate reductase family protein [Hufsiella ginkgonis]MXV16852.1 phosphoadenosine phosphosulfate reductase family protein [Hufsiella ginkgonis]
MKATQTNLFEGSPRLQMNDSIELTIQSILAYGPRYKHWCMAWSGGKDSTTLVTLIVWLIKSGRIPAPQTLTVMYADTRLELTPLFFAAQEIMEELRELFIEVRTVMAPLEKRFMTYILGRGVPPPNNNTFRWCTRQIKIDPMRMELERLFRDRGEKVLMLTGVRQGESAIRDQRIMMSCGKDGAECGQGWYQETMPEALCDTLAPILHWRVCHVWEWLKHWAPLPEYGDFSTAMVADAYGGDEAEEINARTGCIACPLASKDTALDNLVKRPTWAYLSPLKRLKPIWREMRLPQNRLRKTGKDTTTDKNKQRLGPLTMEARRYAYNAIMAIQEEINREAIIQGKPTVTLLNQEEQDFIQNCWKQNVWPNKWDGTEPTGDVLMDTVYADGSIQPIINFGD